MAIYGHLVLFLFLFHTAKTSQMLIAKDDSWLKLYFPIAIAANLSSIPLKTNKKCLEDTNLQLTALRDGLPWAVESKYIK